MSDLTPNPSTVMAAWIQAHPFREITGVEEREAEFDRMIAKVEQVAAEKAWWAAESAFGQAHDQDNLEPWSYMPDNPYLTRSSEQP